MPISLSTLPEALRPRIGPDAPAPMRMMVARALLPMGPEDLFAALAYLVTNEQGPLKDAAQNSLKEIPKGVIATALKGTQSVDLLDFTVRQWHDDDGLVEAVLLNPLTSDDTFEWLARRAKGRALELISNNQARIIRHGAIVEAVFYNPEASMALVNRVFETGVRNGLSLEHIPGYKEIYESIFGKKPEARTTAQAQPAQQTLDPELEPELQTELLVDETFTRDELVVGVDDDDFVKLLSAVAQEEDPRAPVSDGKGETSNLGALVLKMSVPQKIRLALMGNQTARGLLIKDPKNTVAMAVLRNQRITEKEVAGFAKNKAMSDQVIQAICRNREWTRSPLVQKSLLHHPKTPPMFINRSIRSLSVKELKDLSKSREVPGYVSRLAKGVLAQREAGKKG